MYLGRQFSVSPTCSALGLVTVNCEVTKRVRFREPNDIFYEGHPDYIPNDMPLEQRPPFVDKEHMKRMYLECFDNAETSHKTYHIHRNITLPSVMYCPRWHPLEIRERLKSKLDRMEEGNVIAKVTRPTDWVNYSPNKEFQNPWSVTMGHSLSHTRSRDSQWSTELNLPLHSHTTPEGRLMSKCREDGTDIDIAILNLRSTPLNRNIPSPAELLNNRRYRSNLLVRIAPPQNYEQIKAQFERKQASSTEYHDQHMRTLSGILPGRHVRCRTLWAACGNLQL